jgi:NTE family protein
VFVGDDKVADYLARVQQIGIAGGAVLGTWGQLRVGPVWSRVDAHVDTGSPVLPAVEETNSGLLAALFIDQTDHAWFPTRGVVAGASAYAAMESFGAAANYQRLEGFVRGSRSWGRHVLNCSVYGGTDLDSDMPAYESFTLGGPLRLSGYRVNQFAGREFSFGRLMYYNKTIPLPDILGSGVYVGGSAEVGRIDDQFDGAPSPGTLWSGSVFLGADTLGGPLFLGLGLGESGNWSLYLLLGAP